MKFRGPQALNDTLEDLFHLMVVISIRINHIMPIILSRP